MSDFPKIRSKEWLFFIFITIVVLAAFTLFTLLAGDKAKDLIFLFVGWLFFFALGLIFGQHKK